MIYTIRARSTSVQSLRTAAISALSSARTPPGPLAFPTTTSPVSAPTSAANPNDR